MCSFFKKKIKVIPFGASKLTAGSVVATLFSVGSKAERF
jgi:hypothetical protein